ncbi:MAG: nitrous oxide reductase accessory protein NosL, partial [Thermodesulfobacteriota bacterium]
MVKKIVLALFCLLITVPMSSALGADFIPLDKKDKCPVCGMFVAKYKPWVAQIVFTNNDYRVFDSCTDMV